MQNNDEVYKFKFYLEVPKWMQVTGQVYDLCERLEVDVEYLGEESGILRKTLFFRASSESKLKIKELQKALKKGIDDFNDD